MSLFKPLILAIEDDPDFLRALELILKRFDANFRGTGNPEEFLKLAKTSKADLYLVDLELGQKNGFEIIQKLRGGLSESRPVVVISGSRSADAVTQALELGASDFIMKPLDSVHLATKLSKFLKTDRIEDHRSSLYPIPRGRAPARLQVKAKIHVIDELGLQFSSEFLIPKGTALRLESPIFSKFTVGDQGCLVTVLSTTLDSESGRYNHYGEFDGADAAFLLAVRNWIGAT